MPARTVRRAGTAVVLLALIMVCSPSLAFEPLPRSTPEDRLIDAAALASAFDAAEDLGFLRAMVVVCMLKLMTAAPAWT